MHSNGGGSNPFTSTRNFYERKYMTEEQLEQFLDNTKATIDGYERLVRIQTKQRDYLLAYVSRLVLPVQLNAIIERLENIENDTKRETH